MSVAILETAERRMVEIGRAFDVRDWVPATSGNFSARLSDGRIAITSSGCHKGRMSIADIMTVDAEGRALGAGKPSAETALHTQLYRLFPEVGAVLHTHSPGGVAMTRAFPSMSAWTVSGHELLKALPGISTHETTIRLPIVDNDQDIARIAARIEPQLLIKPTPPAYLIRGHGLYAWGQDITEAERVVEALEWMFGVDLTERLHRVAVPV